jgi:Holliday junction resolvase RusA-like endonuclease
VSPAPVVLPVCPVAAPRQSRRDAWDPSPAAARYRAFRDELRLAARGRYEVGPVLEIRFVLPMPRSWSTRRRELGRGAPHQGKPDVDNLVKGFLDALTEDDSFVWKVEASKVWGEAGEILVWP